MAKDENIQVVLEKLRQHICEFQQKKGGKESDCYSTSKEPPMDLAAK